MTPIEPKAIGLVMLGTVPCAICGYAMTQTDIDQENALALTTTKGMAVFAHLRDLYSAPGVTVKYYRENMLRLAVEFIRAETGNPQPVLTIQPHERDLLTERFGMSFDAANREIDGDKRPILSIPVSVVTADEEDAADGEEGKGQ